MSLFTRAALVDPVAVDIISGVVVVVVSNTKIPLAMLRKASGRFGDLHTC